MGKVSSTTPSFERIHIDDEHELSGNRKRRTVYVPNTSMLRLQRRFVRILRRLDIDYTSATGVRPGSSVKKHVGPHRNNRYFYCADIRNAFGNVNIDRLTKLLDAEGVSVPFILPQFIEKEGLDLSSFLSEYCEADEGGLKTGSPSSQDLFNIYCAVEVDHDLRALCERKDITYTRYVDDLLFSSEQRINPDTRRSIRECLNDAGFGVSHHKCELYDLCQSTITVNGKIGLEYGGRIFVPRDYVNSIRGKLLAAKNTLDRELIAEIHGMMGTFKSVTEKPYNSTEKKLLRLYQETQRLFANQRRRKSITRKS